MLFHTVLLKFRPDTPDGHLETLIRALVELPASVNVIRDYEVRRDLGLDPRNAEIIVRACFDDIDGYQEYSVHPDHRAVIETLILPYLESRSALQHRV